METNKLPELTKKDFNIWKLLDFSLNELTINPQYDLIHHGIYTVMLRINNVNEWKDVIGVPTKHTAETVCGISIKTYRKKLNELQGFGMIRVIKKSSNQWHSSLDHGITLNSTSDSHVRLFGF